MNRKESLIVVILIVVIAGTVGGLLFYLLNISAHGKAIRPVEITLGTIDQAKPALEEIFASVAFRELFPDVVIKLRYSYGYNLSRKLRDQDPNISDIEMLESGILPQFAGEKYVEDLARAPYNGLDLVGVLNDSALAAATTTEGQLVAIPLDIEPAVMLYRKDFMDNHGLDLINGVKTPFDLIPIIKKINSLISVNDKVNDSVYTSSSELVRLSLFGSLVNMEGNDLLFDPKSSFLRALQVAEKYRTAEMEDDFRRALENKDLPLILLGSVGRRNGFNNYKKILAEAVEGVWRVWFLPGWEGQKALFSYGSYYLAIPAPVDENKKDLCWGIVKYLSTSPEAQMRLFGSLGSFPALKSLYYNPAMDIGSARFGGQKVYHILREVALGARVNYLNKRSSDILYNLDKAVLAIIREGKTAEEAYELYKAKN